MKKPVAFDEGNGGLPVATGEGMTPPDALPTEKPTTPKPLPNGPGVAVGEGEGNGFVVAFGSGGGALLCGAGEGCPLPL